ncbi:MAG: alpha/beta hydrolase [Bacilli bacterium]|nr:alpha/beta hydrolase [Bacilli bacterium]
MIQTKNIATKQMLRTISMMRVIRKITKKTLFGLTKDRPQVFVLPKRKLQKHHLIEVTEFAHLKTVIFHSNEKSHHHLIYLHGGAYQLKGKQNHYQFIADLKQKCQGTISFIDYPTSEEATVLETVSKTKEAIISLIQQYPTMNFYLAGDSAGGGLALVLYQLLSKENITIKHLFLMSPWVDLTMSNSDIDRLTSKEFMFTKEELQLAAITYAGETALNHVYLSPIYNDCFNVEHITIYAGKRDILYPDILKFVQTNPKIQLFEYPLLPHVFPLFPGKVERNDVIQNIAYQINQSLI